MRKLGTEKEPLSCWLGLPAFCTLPWHGPSSGRRLDMTTSVQLPCVAKRTLQASLLSVRRRDLAQVFFGFFGGDQAEVHLEYPSASHGHRQKTLQ